MLFRSEPGFAWALYYRVANDAAMGRKAVAWGADQADPIKDLRQLAIVFDWCGTVATEAQADKIAEKLDCFKQKTACDVTGQSARALAAIALADRTKDQGDATLRSIAQWFRSQKSFPHGQAYPLYELMHAYNDNLRIDLREEAKAYFETFPTDHMVSHYPAPFPAPENLYRVPVYVHDGEPDVRDMVLSRAAELEMVALDTNALAEAVASIDAPLVERVAAQLPRVRATLDSGAAITLLDAWASATQRLRPPA